MKDPALCWRRAGAEILRMRSKDRGRRDADPRTAERLSTASGCRKRSTWGRRAGAVFAAAACASSVAVGAGVAPAVPSTSSAVPAKATHHLTVGLSNGAIVGLGDTLKVHQGEAVEIEVASDRAMTLHVHGYELTAEVAPQRRATIAFIATLPGRFPVHQHGGGRENHRAVFFIEVHP